MVAQHTVSQGLSPEKTPPPGSRLPTEINAPRMAYAY